MPMKLIETTVSATTVHMQLADDTDPEKASEWIEFEVPLAKLMIDQHNPLGEPGGRHLAAIQKAALRYMRDATIEESQRLSTQTDR